MKSPFTFMQTTEKIIKSGYSLKSVMGWKDLEFTVVGYKAEKSGHSVTAPSIERLWNKIKGEINE